MTVSEAREKVLAMWPKAEINEDGMIYRVLKGVGMFNNVLGSASTKEMAWIDAASRLPTPVPSLEVEKGVKETKSINRDHDGHKRKDDGSCELCGASAEEVFGTLCAWPKFKSQTVLDAAKDHEAQGLENLCEDLSDAIRWRRDGENPASFSGDGLRKFINALIAALPKVQPQQEEDSIPHRVTVAMSRIKNRIHAIGGKYDERDLQFFENELMDVWEHHSILPTPKPSSLSTDQETFPHALAGYLTKNSQLTNLPNVQAHIEDFMYQAKWAAVRVRIHESLGDRG